jgi:hypothetical protein
MLKHPKTSMYFVKGANAGLLEFGLGSIVKQTVFCWALTKNGNMNKRGINFFMDRNGSSVRQI